MDGQVFNQTTIPLNFNLNESTPWIAYSLDNDIQIAITANTTLTATTGDHTIVVYANDTAGNIGQSETAHFTVRSEIFVFQPISVEVLIIAVLAALVITAALAVIYQKKHSRKLPQKELIPLLF
jgi:ABC-type dipeptide/oligopeptide/nickel transport system permease component